MVRWFSNLTLLLAFLSFACSRDSKPTTGDGRQTPANEARPEQTKSATGTTAPQPAERCQLPALPTVLPAAPRIVAIGDLHGDLVRTRKVFEIAALAKDDQWIGGDTVVVQTGDVLDRGDDEKEIYQWLFQLREQAKQAGGALILLHGNHELMNAILDFRYVTKGGFEDFSSYQGDRFAELPETQRGRAAAFSPGGEWATRLAGNRVAVVVGDSVFVHGGITKKWADHRIEAINRDVRCFLAGQGRLPDALRDDEGPLWTRKFSTGDSACEELDLALRAIPAKRMVVGHTPQMKGITSACDGKVWRIDVGLAKFYGGPAQALEIRGNSVTVLK